MSTLVSGHFTSRARAESAVSALVDAGFASDHISLLSSEVRGVDHPAAQKPSGIHRLAAIVAAAGGAIGALAGGVAAASAVTTPDLPLLSSGPLVLALSGFAAGAATGGLVGALAAGGFPDRSATFVAANVVEDQLVAGVFVQDDRGVLARSVLDACGAEPVVRE